MKWTEEKIKKLNSKDYLKYREEIKKFWLKSIKIDKKPKKLRNIDKKPKKIAN